MQVLLARYERLESGVAYNPVSDEVARDPYAVYRRLRERDPVHRMRLIDAWVLTRYEDADAMLRDHERFGAEERRFHDTGLTTMLDIESAGPHAAARHWSRGRSRRARCRTGRAACRRSPTGSSMRYPARTVST